MTQDTYRGSRSRTETLNLYTYCAGNPISYTDPSGHAFWGVAGAAMGAYDGYKYAKKKNLKGWKKGAAVVGGALLGSINPFKVVKAAKTGYKAYKASKYTKKAVSSAKKTKSVKKASTKAKSTVVTKKTVKRTTTAKSTKKTTQTVKKQTKQVTSSAKPTIHVDSYRNMKKGSSKDLQAHHLNQNAAFSEVIPSNEGLAVMLTGNAITDKGSQHYKVHASMERFWDNYRDARGGPNKSAKIGDYNRALYNSLLEGGLSKPDAAFAVRRAYEQQRQYGLINSGEVSRIPYRMNQKK